MAKAVVLDTTIIVKALVAPFKRLPPSIYDRELRTHEKCKIILKQLEEMRGGLYSSRMYNRNGISYTTFDRR